jgi:hypothetical protein
MPLVKGYLDIVEGDGGVDPGYGNGVVIPPMPGNELPPPPGVWPPPTATHPIVPAEPGTPPGVIWPSPGTPENPIASTPSWVLVYIPGYGWKFVVVDPSLVAGTPLPPPQPQPK